MYYIIIEITLIPKFKVYNCQNLPQQNSNLLDNCLVAMVESSEKQSLIHFCYTLKT